MINVRVHSKKELIEVSQKLYKYGFEYRTKQHFGRDMPFSKPKYNGYLTVGVVIEKLDNDKTLSYTPLGGRVEEVMTIEELDKWLAKKNK